VNRVNWHSSLKGEPHWTGEDRLLAFEMRGTPGRPNLYVMFNTHAHPQRFRIPHRDGGWRRLVDTNLPTPDDIVEERHAVPLQPADTYVVHSHSAVILVG
jgi:glycogen operon protein